MASKINKNKVWPYFIHALFFQSLFSSLRMFSFAPALVATYGKVSFISSLWTAVLFGTALDLFSSSYPFGFYSLNYTLITCLLYRYRCYFVEKPIGFCFLTYLFSSFSTVLAKIFLLFLETKLPVTFASLATDFLIMPALDAFYAFLFFSCPVLFYKSLRKKWFSFLFFIKEIKRRIKESHQN